MRRRTRNLLALVGAAAFLALAVWVAWRSWFSIGDSTMSGHGVLALILGVVGAFALGAGLMALVFYSSRSGHDQ
jgi:hypothetical protein